VYLTWTGPLGASTAVWSVWCSPARLILPFRGLGKNSLNGVCGAGTEDPFPDPFALIRPYCDGHLLRPVIDDFQETPGFIPIVFRGSGSRLRGKLRSPLRQLYLDLCQSQERGEPQYGCKHPGPSHRFAMHRLSSFMVKLVWVAEVRHGGHVVEACPPMGALSAVMRYGPP